MPHKRNPVRCERVSGLARVLRGHAAVALGNHVLWHERDISHSSAERIIFPDSFHLAVFMLEDLTDVIRNLVVYPENIRRNLELTQGVYFSQKVLTLLVDKGLARQRAYELVQALAMRSWREKRSFRELVLADPAIVALCPAAELERAFSLQGLLAGTRDIFKRFARKK
jgi:adenylosuccinate lyase